MIKYGLIAEEQNDIDSVKTLISRLKNGKNISYDKFVGHGCGPIKRKSFAWATILKKKGCNRLIIIHDLDKNVLENLRKKLEDIIKPSPIDKYFICIPIQEIEAWFLSDGECIKNTFNLKKNIKDQNNPEFINDPKEFLESIVDRYSDGSKSYINTRHNLKLSEILSIEKVSKRCKSFLELKNFIMQN